jgi:hypothetical protein
MDDQTEVPDKHLEKGRFRVRYRDSGLPGPSYTRPMSHKEALTRAKLMIGMAEEISQVEVVPEGTIADETGSCFRVEGDDRHEQMLAKAKARNEAAKERVDEDLDASLEEQAREDGRPQCDLCGKYTHSFEDCPAAGEIEEELKASATVSVSYAHRQNRHAALDMAIRVVTSPHSPFRTERASADEIVAYAGKFEAFLNG